MSNEANHSNPQALAAEVMEMIEERELVWEYKEAEEAIAKENELERRNEAYIQRALGFVE
jgi:cell fate (sporulation/competence/biofilm development) regulator YmcA (YheA/YmcA/DUF963 family)